MKKRISTEATKSVRCAIYTRKSTEEGLDQEFNSLDAQRESAEAFIVSQRHEGWEAVTESYDDGGFNRSIAPALHLIMVQDREMQKLSWGSALK
jgi:site-specific DNA recombinase